MRNIIALCALFITFSSFGQLNVDSLGRMNFLFGPHNTMINDVWGYTDELGNEYALVGCEKGTSVVDVSDPTNPSEVFWETGMNSTWRDLKTWGDYAYVTTEALNGLLIIDLSPLPASTVLPVAYYTGPNATDSAWQSAHNLYIDEQGYAYIYGSNRGNGGVIILDVNTDPMNPIELGVFDDWYVHDGFTRGDTMYLGHISDGFMSMVDVTDPAIPVLLGTAASPSTFTHNVWPSSDSQFAFTTDEVSGGYIGAYDISDPANIFEVDRIQSSPGAGVIPHNAHVLGNYIVTSYYSDGVVIHDATYPYNLVEVANYDTYPDQTTGYDGCWGAYPFLPSQNILATDRSEGLFILGPSYSPAAYLEGIVTDAVTFAPIDLANVQITGSNQPELTNNTGFYATGIATAGTYDVVYDKVGYFPQTFSVSLTNGVITIQDVELVPIPPYTFDITVVEAGTGTPIPGAQILCKVPQQSHSGLTNGIGQESLTLFYEGMYDFVVAKWGYYAYCDNMQIDNTTGAITVELNLGYQDDFVFDLGWSLAGSAVTGLWERGDPFGTSSGSAPSDDVSYDCGVEAYVTGNMASLAGDDDDVDQGTAVLFSPVMDLSTYTNPYINYSRWFYCHYGPQTPDDSLRVRISNGISSVQIDAVGPLHPDSVGWVDISLPITDYISLTSTMQVMITTSDISPAVNITEAAFDKFYIVEEANIGLDEAALSFVVYPNPTEGKVYVSGILGEQDFVLVANDGTVVQRGVVSSSNNEINIQNLPNGSYFLQLGETTHKVFKVN
ncbi:MAG: choice-of-anchor B family protein [Crocinitomicaceae bacterium]|nr:choice-of-anchor B family protein [Crocinitomicaceae bacterium]